MRELWQRSGLELAELIRRRKLSPVEVVEAHIVRIEAVNPTLNAVVVKRFEQAREEARRAEAAVLQGAPLPPFHGVPCTVKEAIGVAGFPSTSGSVYRRHCCAEEDAPAVRRLRAAGAIILGLTNLSEMALWIESENIIYGRTVNPYDSLRTAGGSSGGEGAIIGAGGSPIGLGSDGGGSVRLPSAFCGIFGHKPSSGAVPLTGHFPCIPEFAHLGLAHWSRYASMGPMARRAEDLMPLLRVIAGPDGRDAHVVPMEWGDPREVRFEGVRLLVCENPRILGASRASPDVRSAVGRAARILSECGARVEVLRSDTFSLALFIWSALMSENGSPQLRKILGGGAPLALAQELLHQLSGQPNHTPASLLMCLIEQLVPPSPRAMAWFAAEGRRLRDELHRTLRGGGLLVMPAFPHTAPPHRFTLRSPFDFGYAAIFNALGLPVTVAPVGIAPDGLPVAVQLVSAHGQDHVTIAAALRLEEALGGWRMPRVIAPSAPSVRISSGSSFAQPAGHQSC